MAFTNVKTNCPSPFFSRLDLAPANAPATRSSFSSNALMEGGPVWLEKGGGGAVPSGDFPGKFAH
jgi:hypothetical protein